MCDMWHVTHDKKNSASCGACFQYRRQEKHILSFFSILKKKNWKKKENFDFEKQIYFEIFRFWKQTKTILIFFRFWKKKWKIDFEKKVFFENISKYFFLRFSISKIFCIDISRKFDFEHYFDSKTHVCDIRLELAPWPIVHDNVKFWKFSKNLIQCRLKKKENFY